MIEQTRGLGLWPSLRTSRAGTPFFTRTEPGCERSPAADVHVTVVGAIVLLHPLTRRATAWLAENVQLETQHCCGALVMSLESLEDIVTGLRNDGMAVA